MPLSPGTSFGPYAIIGALGAGGMGEVYRARDNKLERDVAVKVLPEELASDPERLRRFEREARAASALSHPNIVTIYDIGEHEGTAYIVMELVEGRTLRAWLDDGPIPTDRLGRYGAQIAEGLAKAHSAGIIHRDLKPENIIISDDGYVKILDFGLAKLHAAPEGDASSAPTVDKGDTTPGTILGTLAYMSPEQAKGLDVDARSDQFALGAILHEMATGKPLFRRDSPAETLSAVLRDAPGRLSDAPRAFASVVSRLLEKEPDSRYPSTAEILPALQTTTSAIERGEPSIAVLPFTNLSADSDTYFSDGLADEIITDLSKLRAIKVISRASSAKLKQAGDELRSLATALDVQYVLEGSIRRAGDSLRVTAQLIDVAADQNLWAEKYTGTMDDVFAIQEKLSRTIVDALKVQLTGDEDREIGERPIEDARAFDCFLRARHEYYRFTKDGIEAALRYADDGLEITGPNVRLYLAKGHAHHRLSLVDNLHHHEHLATCREWTEKSLELEPDFVPARALLGMVRYDLFETVEGFRGMKEAYERDPNDLENLGWLCWVYGLSTVQHDRTTELVGRLLARDPLSAFTQNAAGQSLWFANRLDNVGEHFAKAQRLDPSPQSSVAYAQYLAAFGRTNEAIELLTPFEESPQDHSWKIPGLTLKHALSGDGEAFDELLTEEVLRAAATDILYAFMMSERYALMGRRDQGLEWLALAVDAGVWNTDFLKADPLLESLRTDPEFDRLLDRAREKAKQLDAD